MIAVRFALVFIFALAIPHTHTFWGAVILAFLFLWTLTSLLRRI